MALEYGIENSGIVVDPDRRLNIDDSRGAVRPTLIIGLGGSGKEVLLRLRRLFWEKHEVVGWPIMEYLWFDTDLTPGGLFGRAPDHIDQQVELNPDERIEASIPRSRTETIWNSRSTESHLAKWLAMDELRAASEMGITQGAKQIRPFGRLAFFEHFERIQRMVEFKLNRLQAQQNAGLSLPGGVEVDATQREIVIVASLAGGTGSGSFLDFGFLCKHLSQGDALITAILFLPQVFKGLKDIDIQATYANGYAALMELNRYLLPRPRHEAVGNGQGQYYMPSWPFEWRPGVVSEVSAPPFDVTYLLDQSNHHGVLGATANAEKRVDEGEAACREVMHMVAESLLLDFEGSRLSTDKRRWRSNAMSHLTNSTTFVSRDPETNQTVYSEQFPSRFCSFGLSKIQVNRARLEKAASYLLGSLMVGSFLKRTSLTGWSGDWQALGLDPAHARQALLQGPEGKTMVDLEQRIMEKDLRAMEDRASNLAQFIMNNLEGPVEGAAFDFYQDFERIMTGSVTENDIVNVGPKDWREYLDLVYKQFGQFFSECDQKSLALMDQGRAMLTKRLVQAGKGSPSDGEHTRGLQRNRVAYEESVKERILAEVLECLAEPNSRGLAYATLFLTELESRIKQAREEVRQEQAKVREESEAGKEFQRLSPNALRRAEDEELRRLEQWAAEAQDMPAWPLSFFGRDGVKEWHHKLVAAQNKIHNKDDRGQYNQFFLDNLRVLMQHLKRRREAAAEWVRQALGDACVREMEEVLNVVERFRSDQLARISQFADTMHELESSLRTKYRSFSTGFDSVYIRDLDLGWSEAKFEAVIAQALKKTDLREHCQELFHQYLTSHRHGGEPVTFAVGVRELLDLIVRREQNATAWDEFIKRLEAFCQITLRGFSKQAAIPTVLERLEHLAYHDPGATRGILLRAIKGAAVRLRQTSYGPHMYANIRRRGLLGVGEPDHPALEVFLRGRSARLNDINLGETFEAQVVGYSDDSIVLYEEQVALPLFLMGGGARVNDGLAALEQSYHLLCLSDAAAEDAIFKRHIDKHYQNLCGVLPPEDDKSTERITQGYRPLLLGLALGLVHHDPVEGFYRKWEEQGMERSSLYRNSLSRAVRYIAEDDRRELNRLVEERLNLLRQKAPEKMEELLALILFWQNKVFVKPQNLLYQSVYNLRKELLAEFQAQGRSWEGGLKDRIANLVGRKGVDEVIDYQAERMDAFSRVLEYDDDLLDDRELRVLRRPWVEEAAEAAEREAAA